LGFNLKIKMSHLMQAAIDWNKERNREFAGPIMA